MSDSSTETARGASLRIVFPAAQAVSAEGVSVGVPSLNGLAVEELFPEARFVGESAGVQRFAADGLEVGYASVSVADGNFSTATQQLYARIFAAARGRQLYRMWNYVPAINAAAAGLENYRAFCRGRSLAFEMEFGAEFQRKLPSASAVGCDGDVLSTVFVAGDAEPRHIENPEQVPAYHYPAEHGPRSPSFARATVAATAAGKLTFISGTAAIKGHATVRPDSLEEQLTCTLDNLRIISRAAEAGDRLGAGTGVERNFKIYLRYAEDFAAVKRRLEAELLTAGDRVIYLRADICRAALAVEIEATLVARP
jgi:hypothetical protein